MSTYFLVDIMFSNVAIIIPSRIGSTRLSQKALQPIGNMTMIEHVYSNIAKIDIPHLYVATDSEQISQIVQNIGGKAIITKESCASGTDRVYEAFKQIPDNHNISYVVNVQGDLPFVNPNTVLDIIKLLRESGSDIATPVAKVSQEKAYGDSNVKAVIGQNDQALYFSRSMIPNNATEYFYHIGIYGYTTSALERFVALPISPLEQTERLEQLRALENGMKIAVCYSDEIPISIDTMEDLENARAFYKQML